MIESPRKVLMGVAKEMNRASRDLKGLDLPYLLRGWAGHINDVALAMAAPQAQEEPSGDPATAKPPCLICDEKMAGAGTAWHCDNPLCPMFKRAATVTQPPAPASPGGREWFLLDLGNSTYAFQVPQYNDSIKRDLIERQIHVREVVGSPLVVPKVCRCGHKGRDHRYSGPGGCLVMGCYCEAWAPAAPEAGAPGTRGAGIGRCSRCQGFAHLEPIHALCKDCISIAYPQPSTQEGGSQP